MCRLLWVAAARTNAPTRRGDGTRSVPTTLPVTAARTNSPIRGGDGTRSVPTTMVGRGGSDELPDPPRRRHTECAYYSAGANRAWKNRRYFGSYTILNPRILARSSWTAATLSATTSMCACVYTRRGIVSRTSSSFG